jgi:hypothetical protein
MFVGAIFSFQASIGLSGLAEEILPSVSNGLWVG